jgi:hypothetical protein
MSVDRQLGGVPVTPRGRPWAQSTRLVALYQDPVLKKIGPGAFLCPFWAEGVYAHRANGKPSEARKQEVRSRLIHPSSWKSFVDGGSGMLRLALAEHRLDRLSSGEQTGHACRKSAAVIASQSCWQRKQHGCNQRKKVRMKCFNRLARTAQPCPGCRMPRP